MSAVCAVQIKLRLAAAVKWYEMGTVSQEKAAEIAGLTRKEFIFALGRFGVSPFQYSAEEIKKECTYSTSRPSAGELTMLNSKPGCGSVQFRGKTAQAF